MMRHSIKRQMIVVFLGLLVSFVAALFMINLWFLEPYYIGNKKTQFIGMYEELNQTIKDGILKDGLLTDEEAAGRLAFQAEMNNISFLVADGKDGYLTNVHDKEQLKNQLLGYLLNQAQKDGRVLEDTDTYQINQSWNPWNQTEYIEMWGELENDIIEIRGLKIDKTARRVYVDGEERIFTTKEFDLLTFLAENPNHVYSKEELFREIWDMDSIGDIATVTVHIKKIREKIEYETAKPQYIETIWGVGYRFRV